jgi:hypothetical protein
VCVVLAVGALFSQRFELWDVRLTLMGLCGLSLAWWFATIVLTPSFALPQAVTRGFGPASKLRKAARLLPIGWVMATFASLAREFLSASSPAVVFPTPTTFASLLGFAQVVGFLLGMAGIVVLCILLERLADWTRDSDAQRMFNWSMWLIPILSPMLFMSSLALPFLYSSELIIPIVWLVAAGFFPYGLLSLSKSVTLSIVHSFEQEERARRSEERKAQHFSKVVDRVR